MRRSTRRILQTVLLAVVYATVARLALMMDAVSGFATLVWPSSGIALAALLIVGDEAWPGVLVGAFAVNVVVGAPPLVALGIAAGNTLEAVVGSQLLRRVVGVQRSLARLRDVLGLVIFAAALSTMLSATIGVMSLRAGGLIPASAFGSTWRAWWLGDALGDLVIGSLLLAWNEVAHVRPRDMPRTEAIAVGTLLVVLASLLFFRRSAASEALAFLEAYALFPPLIWAALRFGLRGATVATLVLSVIALTGTALGCGPFVRERLADGLFFLQSFMGVVASTGLVLAGATTDRARAVESRDDVLAIVTHDLRNPLSATLLRIASAERALARGDVAAAPKHLAFATRSATRMGDLLGDLVDLGAIDAGHLSLNVEPNDVTSLVRDAVDGMQALSARTTIELVAISPRSAPAVVCDRQRLMQVFSNLIDNAIKHTGASGKVIVAADAHDGTVRFSVTDTGSGIHPYDLPHVFDRFRRGSHVDRPGMGLGLYIVRGIVEAHGSHMLVESKLGGGTTFSFVLPVAEDAESVARSAVVSRS